MSWRTVCISKRAKLELRMGALLIRSEETLRINISEISVLIIESTAVSVTASLLCELMCKKIKVIFCDEQHNPISELIPHYGSHDASAALRRQVQWKKQIKGQVWACIVSDKIQMQAEHLLARELPEGRMLLQYLSEVEVGDATNREGHAAKVYFNTLFGMDFLRQADSSINAALNYGYSLILSLLNREVVAGGRVTQLGIWHSNTFNPFNLSSDLMEPFRVLVDKYVCDMQLASSDFTSEKKHELLEVLEMGVMINGNFQRLPNALRIYCQKVLQALDQEDTEILPTIGYV